MPPRCHSHTHSHYQALFPTRQTHQVPVIAATPGPCRALPLPQLRGQAAQLRAATQAAPCAAVRAT